MTRMTRTGLLLVAIATVLVAIGCGDKKKEHHEDPSSVEVLPANPTAVVGTTVQFTATAHFEDGDTEDVTGESIWASGTAGVATIDATGLATTLSTGMSVITATHDEVPGTTTLTVTTGG